MCCNKISIRNIIQQQSINNQTKYLFFMEILVSFYSINKVIGKFFIFIIIYPKKVLEEL